MIARLRQWLVRSPAIRDALIWTVPAIVFGLGLRVVLTLIQPYAYWGSDSSSYFSFPYRVLTDGVWSIPEKRRYVYPLVLLPLSVLPGAALGWVLAFQHALGLLTLVPLAYVVRKAFVAWRWWVIPVTCAYAGMPIVLWYEHELLGEAFFFATMIWAFAAWVAWVGRLGRRERGEWVWWVFLAAFALCVLTKPSGRFFWPGLVVGLVYLRAWKWLDWRQAVALVAVAMGSWTLGEGSQASRLLYSSAFPLTQLESLKHADLKREIAPLVQASRERIDYFYLEDDDGKNFLRGGFRDGEFSAWQQLDKSDRDALYRAMRDLALEGITAEPHLFIYIALQRTVGSLNWTEFKLRRFEADYFASRFKNHFRDMREEPEMLQILFGLSADEPVPPYHRMVEHLHPPGREALAGWMTWYADSAARIGKFVEHPQEDGRKRTLGEMTPTVAGWWLLVGLCCAVIVPRFRASLGVWSVVAVGYAVAVHLVGSANPRFFAPAWPVLLVAMAAPLDLAAAVLLRRRSAARTKDS